MVLFAFAVPGRFGEWCDALIARLVEAALGSVLVVPANSADDIAIDFIRNEGANFVVTGPQPGPWLCRILKLTEKPFTIALDDPRDAALELIYRHGLDTPDAIRRVGNSCAAMMTYITLPGVLVLNSARDWIQPVETAERIARHFGLTLPMADLERVVGEIAAAGLGPEPPAAEPWSSDPQAEAVTAAVNGAVTPYVDHFLGEPFGPITWARDLVMADGHMPAAHAVDITGRVRALFYGPYISVPPGNWTAEVVLGFSKEAMEVSFAVDLLVAGVQLCATNIQPNRPGVYSINLSFEIGEDNTHPLEFRVVNEKPAFDGRVALGRITLTLQRDAPNMGVSLREELGLSA